MGLLDLPISENTFLLLIWFFPLMSFFKVQNNGASFLEE